MNKQTMLGRFALVLTLCFATIACQRPASDGAVIEVEDAHMRVMPPGQDRAAAYLSLINKGAEDRQILHVEASIAGEVQVHRHSYDNGMMKMRRVAHATVPAGARLDFAPGGYHLMLLDIDDPPAQGDEFTVSIEFDGGHSLTFPVEVRGL